MIKKNNDFFELLINFNSFGFIREACNALNVKFDISGLEDLVEIDNNSSINNQKSITDLNEVAGGDYWQGIIEGYKKGVMMDMRLKNGSLKNIVKG